MFKVSTHWPKILKLTSETSIQRVSHTRSSNLWSLFSRHGAFPAGCGDDDWRHETLAMVLQALLAVSVPSHTCSKSFIGARKGSTVKSYYPEIRIVGDSLYFVFLSTCLLGMRRYGDISIQYRYGGSRYVSWPSAIYRDTTLTLIL